MNQQFFKEFVKSNIRNVLAMTIATAKGAERSMEATTGADMIKIKK